MRAVALAVVLILCGTACGDDDSSASNRTPSATGAAGGRDYEASTDGLKQMLDDLLDAVRANNRGEIDKLTGALALPDPAAWFESTFGSERGPALATEYRPVVGQFDQLAELLTALVKSGQTDVRIEVFAEAGNPEATGYQNLALAAMKKPTPLYSARFTKVEDASGFHLWSFVHLDGRFRWVGKMKALSDGTPAEPDLLELRARLARQASAGDKNDKK